LRIANSYSSRDEVARNSNFAESNSRFAIRNGRAGGNVQRLTFNVMLRAAAVAVRRRCRWKLPLPLAPAADADAVSGRWRRLPLPA